MQKEHQNPYYREVSPPPSDSWLQLSGHEGLQIAMVSLYVIENSGIRLLAAILRQKGYRVHEIYFKDWVTNRLEPPTESELEHLVETIRDLGVDLVGISVRASAFHCMAADITERIRRELAIPVMWGGMHPTSCPEDAARVADLLCIGEAETSVASFLDSLGNGTPPAETAGFWLHTEKGIVRNDPAPIVQDLDSLPFPDFHSADKLYIDNMRVRKGDPYRDQPIYLIMGSRGCPFPSCTFCSNSVIDRLYPDQPFHRLRSVDHVLAEVQYAKETFPNLTRIRFDDEEFPVKASWFDEFCQRWPKEAGLPFEVHMDPRVVTAERLERLKAVGLDMVFTGIQSTEKINRELYCRNVSDAQVLKAARTIHQSGIHAGYQVILDDPVSTTEDKRQLFELLLQLPRPYEMILFSLTLYPMSALSEDLQQRGLIDDEDIEGPSTKAFRQFRVDLSYERSREDRFWTSLVVLVSKGFVPKALLRRWAKSAWLMRHPGPLMGAAFTANVLKLGIMGLKLLLRGEMSWAIVRRWLNLKSLVTY